jgi:hypothetical protein
VRQMPKEVITVTFRPFTTCGGFPEFFCEVIPTFRCRRAYGRTYRNAAFMALGGFTGYRYPPFLLLYFLGFPRSKVVKHGTNRKTPTPHVIIPQTHHFMGAAGGEGSEPSAVRTAGWAG